MASSSKQTNKLLDSQTVRLLAVNRIVCLSPPQSIDPSIHHPLEDYDKSKPAPDRIEVNSFVFMIDSLENVGNFKILKHVEAVGNLLSSLQSTFCIVNGGCKAANPKLGGRSQDVTKRINNPLSISDNSSKMCQNR